MKQSLLLVMLLSITSLLIASNSDSSAQNIKVVCPTDKCEEPSEIMMDLGTVTSPSNKKDKLLAKDSSIRITVTGQGVAPMQTNSPAQAYALAKRAATADAYRLIAEKVKGVRVDGEDTIQNMMVKRSTVRTSVRAMVRNANIVETTFKDGLCEVEMEIVLSHAQFSH